MSTATLPPTLPPALTRKDFQTDQEVRWCPGCGDYAILAAVQAIFPELGIKRENFVVVSGIGCSSRFPYYMNTFGFHTIHGRAPAVATGIKAIRPDLEVWVATGDGDALSIGGNHTIHMLRRNVGLKVLLFNNRIYGLTKGQYSPTSEVGKKAKSTPFGSIDRPFNPISLAIGAEATFVARSVDVFQQHLKDTLRQAAAHKGSAFVEILQNCNIFNDGAWFDLTEKEARSSMSSSSNTASRWSSERIATKAFAAPRTATSRSSLWATASAKRTCSCTTRIIRAHFTRSSFRTWRIAPASPLRSECCAPGTMSHATKKS
jgi:2-oxoglutarate ferredoxin oxidoreductase subunit beta